MTSSTKPEVHIVSQSTEKDRATVTNKVQWFWHVVLDMRANRHLGINYFAAAGLNECFRHLDPTVKSRLPGAMNLTPTTWARFFATKYQI